MSILFYFIFALVSSKKEHAITKKIFTVKMELLRNNDDLKKNIVHYCVSYTMKYILFISEQL